MHAAGQSSWIRRGISAKNEFRRGGDVRSTRGGSSQHEQNSGVYSALVESFLLYILFEMLKHVTKNPHKEHFMYINKYNVLPMQ